MIHNFTWINFKYLLLSPSINGFVTFRVNASLFPEVRSTKGNKHYIDPEGNKCSSGNKLTLTLKVTNYRLLMEKVTNILFIICMLNFFSLEYCLVIHQMEGLGEYIRLI